MKCNLSVAKAGDLKIAACVMSIIADKCCKNELKVEDIYMERQNIVQSISDIEQAGVCRARKGSRKAAAEEKRHGG